MEEYTSAQEPQATVLEAPVNVQNDSFEPSGKSFFSSRIFIVIIALIALTLGSLGTYFFLNSKDKTETEPITTMQTTTTTPTTTITDKTVDWKTYKSSTFGYELKIPPAVEINEVKDDQYNRITYFKDEGLQFEVMLRKNPGSITLDNYYYMDHPVARKTTLADIPANIYELVNAGDGPSNIEPSITMVTEKDSELYHISFYGDTKLSDIENKILSTFKFTE
ncbi:hypothetical protein KKG52_03360 [Patescibacteria group bacterium]|nr:hypothetical protein [Patescibacteria group bacterium]